MSDNLVYRGTTFPNNTWGILENNVINSIKKQINDNFVNQTNLFINGTWFSPNINYECYIDVVTMDGEFDNLFFLTTVDPPQITIDDIIKLSRNFGSPTVYFLGNFDHSQYEFNFISYAITQEFKDYEDDLILTDIKYNFINYNRKPATHRVELVTSIIDSGLDNNAIVTLGKHPSINDTDELYMSINEKNKDFVETGHWFDLDDKDSDFGIPHDLLSLGNMEYWKHHFINIVSETMFNPWDPIFVTEKTFKPNIGLRPFIINGNTRTYKWLRNNGFKTFSHYFPFVDLESINKHEIVSNIIEVLKWVDVEPNANLMSMYNDMLPDLLHNKERFYVFANEQQHKMEHLF